jgi:hypothetical protein
MGSVPNGESCDGDATREQCLAMESSHGDTASVQRMVSLEATSEAA